MAAIRDITALCKAGKLADAYELAKADMEVSPDNVWTQRGMGWALYYLLRDDCEKKRRQEFYEHFRELTELDLLTADSDSMIFENVLWKLAEYLKNIPDENTEEVNRLFPLLCKYHFSPSKGYSFLLKSVLGFESWPCLVEFFEWWNLDNLQHEDYQQFQLENGRKIMALAEQAYIACSKALLRLNDKDKIRAFLPRMEQLMDDYPEMMYPGYFCGKLMLALGAAREDALENVLPFARKKSSEFWVWQLLGEMYRDDPDMQLACLLRAVHCRTQEAFLGKVRMKLVSLYVSRKDYSRGKYHLDQVTRCYVQQGWRLPVEVQNWMRESWVHVTVADSSDGMDYRRMTDAILAHDTNESIAVVTYVDEVRKCTFLIYGKEQRACVRTSDLKLYPKEGLLLKLKWMPDERGINVMGTEVIKLSAFQDLPYIRFIEGSLDKRPDKPFAFIRQGDVSCYIRPDMLEGRNLNGGDTVYVLAVWDYSKKKNAWNWTCVKLKKENRK